MSDQPQSYAFPQRAPVFTAAVVIAGLALFGWFVHRLYHPAGPVNPLALANPADFGEDQRWKMTSKGRALRLKELREHEQAELATYGWIDQKAGVVRVPIDRAIDLTVEEYGRK